MSKSESIIASIQALQAAQKLELKEKTRSSLVELMQETNTSELVFCVYTEPGSTIVEYFGPSEGQRYCAKYSLDAERGSGYVAKTTEEHKEESDVERVWHKGTLNIGYLFFQLLAADYGARDTNCQGVIRLNKDGTLKVVSQPYYPDYE